MTWEQRKALEARQDQCGHPIERVEISTHEIRNCPAEGWPDEQVRVIRCKECDGGIVATGTEDMIGFLLEHVKQLSAQVRKLKS